MDFVAPNEVVSDALNARGETPGGDRCYPGRREDRAARRWKDFSQSCGRRLHRSNRAEIPGLAAL